MPGGHKGNETGNGGDSADSGEKPESTREMRGKDAAWPKKNGDHPQGEKDTA
jgi:hypothetical protein